MDRVRRLARLELGGIMRKHARVVAVLCSAALVLSVGTSSAQGNLEVLRSFIEPAYPPQGRLLEVPSGRLFGVAERAGAHGLGALLAYDRQPDGTLTATEVRAFSGPDGAGPMAGVILGSDGALYGTTVGGGTENRGTVYRLGPDGTFSVLHSFTETTGLGPKAPLVEASDGDLYGTTAGTGEPGTGTIFRITKSGTLTVLRRLENDAFEPEDALIDGGDGKLYGVTRNGGAFVGGCCIVGRGTFYSITPDGVFTVLHQFDSPGLVQPTTLIDGRDGFFYGASINFNDPSVFRMSRTGVLTVLHDFEGDGNQNNWISLLRGADGHLYGTTARNGSRNEGTLFRFTLAGALTTLHSFSFVSGAHPSSLIQTADGTLFGGTLNGGLSRRGVIFRATTSGQVNVANMFTGTDPLLSLTSLIAGPDGALYGGSCLGGAFNVGTVFRIMADGSDLTVLHSFAYWDGGCPRGALTFGHDGALYGAASHYGLAGRGTLFKVTTSGSFTPLYFFNGGTNGGAPYGGVFFASDGNYYGTTHNGGALQGGTIFRMTPGGALTTLHHFDGTGGFFGGALPEAPLMQASNGTIYGGTLTRPFRMTLAGGVTVFEPIDVAIRGAMIEGLDGHLYGTTGNASADVDIRGRLFRMTLDGAITTLHTFSGPDGNAAYAGLRLAPDGWFYGATGVGGAQNRGTLFRFSGAGAPITLHEFSGSDGATPFATMTLGSDGALYGTTMFGGQGTGGVIFRLKLP
jgi:uncharacterized repeat protein (TIGR03803 family)